MQSGIAGHVYRTRESFAAERFEEDYEGYVDELIREWHYIERDARKLNPATRAWMAVPLKAPSTSRIQGILYLDSTDRDFFTAARQRLVIDAAYGVALFVVRRYPNS